MEIMLEYEGNVETMNEPGQILISPIRAVINDMEDTADYIFCSSEKAVLEDPLVSSFDNILLLHFFDTEEDTHPMAFQDSHAERILSFLSRPDANETLFVCCDSGESRSSAIAASVLLAIGRSDQFIWDSADYHPNLLVFRRMCSRMGIGLTEEEIMRRKERNNTAFRKQERRAAMEDLLEKAMNLARVQFEGRTDKAGVDYYTGHLCTVAGLVSSDEEKTVAFLHDILEDTDYPEKKLREEFGDRIVDAVVLLTHREHMDEEGYLNYIRRLKASGNELAIAVKIADLTNNSDYTRLGASGPEELQGKDRKRWEKYQKSLEILKGNA